MHEVSQIRICDFVQFFYLQECALLFAFLSFLKASYVDCFHFHLGRLHISDLYLLIHVDKHAC